MMKREDLEISFDITVRVALEEEDYTPLGEVMRRLGDLKEEEFKDVVTFLRVYQTEKKQQHELTRN